MIGYLWLVPLLPLAGFLISTGCLGRLDKRLVPWIGAGSVGFAALLAGLIGYEFLTGSATFYKVHLWTWATTGDFTTPFGLYLDALSLNMMLVVTFVGFLIHIYSAGFMREDPGYARFFGYMNLFVFAMLVLVLSDNLAFMFIGWEGVGLSSYLLIGFWYQEPANGAAARKAFVMTRIGDTALMVGLFLLFTQLGSLDIQTLMSLAPQHWQRGSSLATIAAALLLGGALGKSAQLPLQTWLPDAMAGPTPISALIHAATMVTAGVYLIARTHVLFELSPLIMDVIAVIGALTLLLASCSALAQHDIKRILAYSTISQLGYMFLALGTGAFSAAIFHLTTHAFFKALLFLGAGAVLHCYDDEHDIFRMGGLRHSLPVSFWSFVIGSSALTALPFTAGYFSKHEILTEVYSSSVNGQLLWAIGVTGAVLTGLYSFRLLFIAFFGDPKRPATEHLGLTMSIPLVILGIGAIFGGLIRIPLESVFPATEVTELEPLFNILTEAAPLLGLGLASAFFLTHTWSTEKLLHTELGSALERFWFNGWEFDYLYEKLVVKPFRWFARTNEHDAVDGLYTGIADISRMGSKTLSKTQNGNLRGYAAVLLTGLIIVLAMGLLS